MSVKGIEISFACRQHEWQPGKQRMHRLPLEGGSWTLSCTSETFVTLVPAAMVCTTGIGKTSMQATSFVSQRCKACLPYSPLRCELLNCNARL